MAKILHLIDSLAPGGAERVAVNLVNELNGAGHTAWLCATRAEGMLKSSIAQPKQYVFLMKRSVADLPVLLRLIKLIRREKIEIIHAHSSSLFWAVAAKWFTDCKLVWHDHFGYRTKTPLTQKILLKLASVSIDSVCCVSNDLANWAEKHLLTANEKIYKVNHFAILKGERGIKDYNPPTIIICVANLRPEKDHLNLLQALMLLSKDFEPSEIHLRLLGQDAGDYYQSVLRPKIVESCLENYVEYVGAQEDVAPWLFQSDIGVLCSRWEGLPVALLEYGLAGLAVVCTDVGACCEVLEGGEHGLIVPPANSIALADALRQLLEDAPLRQQLGSSLEAHMRAKYSAEAAIRYLEMVYREVLN